LTIDEKLTEPTSCESALSYTCVTPFITLIADIKKGRSPTMRNLYHLMC